jgi:hypothetical protein
MSTGACCVYACTHRLPCPVGLLISMGLSTPRLRHSLIAQGGARTEDVNKATGVGGEDSNGARRGSDARVQDQVASDLRPSGPKGHGSVNGNINGSVDGSVDGSGAQAARPPTPERPPSPAPARAHFAAAARGSDNAHAQHQDTHHDASTRPPVAPGRSLAPSASSAPQPSQASGSVGANGRITPRVTLLDGGPAPRASPSPLSHAPPEVPAHTLTRTHARALARTSE